MALNRKKFKAIAFLIFLSLSACIFVLMYTPRISRMVNHELENNVLLSNQITNTIIPMKRVPLDTNIKHDIDHETVNMIHFNHLLDHIKVKVEENKMNELPLESLLQCWSSIFMTSFIAREMKHIFSDRLLNKTNNMHLLELCALKNTNTLVINTQHSLRYHGYADKTLYSFHDLIALRRIIQLIHLQFSEKHESYDDLIHFIHGMETKYMTTIRKSYPVFNIHLPRSAGTTMCNYFKNASIKQQKQQQPNEYQTTIKPCLQHNCNVGDGLYFRNLIYNKEMKGKTCNEQYKMTENYTFVARESPLYHNMDKNNLHPNLCEKFVYVLAIRSPIERIMSDLVAHSKESKYVKNGTTKGGEWIRLKKGDESDLANLFHALFGTNTYNERTHIVTVDNKSIKLSAIGFKWVPTYSSNALTKWIGYEWDQYESPADPEIVIESLLVDNAKIGDNDLYLYNAINTLLKIDYVLNFAAYKNDSTAVKAMKYSDFAWLRSYSIENKPFGEQDEYSIFESFQTHMNDHYNISRNASIFEWGRKDNSREGGKTLSPSKISEALTENDWKALYAQNAFDFKLYVLAKWIEKIDHEYYGI